MLELALGIICVQGTLENPASPCLGWRVRVQRGEYGKERNGSIAKEDGSQSEGRLPASR